MSERVEVPAWTVKPRWGLHSQAHSHMLAVPFARFEPLEVGWLGLIGIHRSILQAVHFEGKWLKRCVATRTMPLVSILTMGTQFGIAKCIAEARGQGFQPFTDFEALNPIAYGHESPGQYCYIDAERPVGWILPLWPVETRAIWDHHNSRMLVRTDWGTTHPAPIYDGRRRLTPASLLSLRLEADPTTDPIQGFQEWAELARNMTPPLAGPISRRSGGYLADSETWEAIDANGYDGQRDVPTRRRAAPQYRATPYQDALEEWPAATGETENANQETETEAHPASRPANGPTPQRAAWGLTERWPTPGPAPGERESSSEDEHSDDPLEQNVQPRERLDTMYDDPPPRAPWRYGPSEEDPQRMVLPNTTTMTVPPEEADWYLSQAATFVADQGITVPSYRIVEAEEVTDQTTSFTRTVNL